MKEPPKPHPIASKQALDDVLHALKDLLRNELGDELPPSLARRTRPAPAPRSAPVPPPAQQPAEKSELPLLERPIPDLFDDLPVLTEAVTPQEPAPWDDVPVLEEVVAPSPAPHDIAARVAARLDEELRAAGQPPLPTVIIGRLEAVLREVLSENDTKTS